jgi:ERCC4-type nuclease
MPERVRIIADVQEARSGIPGLLEELGAEVDLAPLPAGDYALGRRRRRRFDS